MINPDAVSFLAAIQQLWVEFDRKHSARMVEVSELHVVVADDADGVDYELSFDGIEAKQQGRCEPPTGENEERK